jgi:tetratricopeptide (TPR) repeat protein
MQSAPAESGKESAAESARSFHAQILLAVLVLIIIAAFLNSLSGQFVYDDVQQVDSNQILGHWDRATILRVLTHDIKATLRQDLPDGHVYSYYYRPAFVLYLMAIYEVAGHRPFLWHCASLVLHILTTLLAFLVVRKILGQASVVGDRPRNNLAFFAALIFAIHPNQCESVSWISGSVNPLAAALGLSSFYTYLIYRESIQRGEGAVTWRTAIVMAVAGILCGLALLAKESALFVVLLIAGHEFFVFPKAASNAALPPLDRRRGVLQSRLLSLAPIALAAIAYLTIRVKVLGVFTGDGGAGGWRGGLIQTAKSLLTLPGLIARYERLMAFPSRLSVNYDFDRVSTLTFGAFWAPLLLLLATGLLLWLLWTKSTVARIGVLWLVFPLLPHLNPAFFSREELVHDRYLYLSLLGAGILVFLAANSAKTLLGPGLTRYLPALAAGLVLLLCILTVSQNMVWRDSRALWSNAVQCAPNSKIAHFWLGTLAESSQDPDEAARQYSWALRADPNCIDCLNNLAFIYAHQGRWDDSIQAFEQVVSVTPEHSIAHFNLSFAYAVVRRYRDAIREQKVAIELDPNGPRIEEWRARERQLEALAEGPDA